MVTSTDMKPIQKLKCPDNDGLATVAQHVIPKDMEVTALSVHDSTNKFLHLPPRNRRNKRN